MKMRRIVIQFFQKYKNLLSLNRSIAVSGLISFMVGIIFTELYAKYAGPESNIENSVYTLAVGHASYLPVFAYLFYRDNKDRYVDPNSGALDSKKLLLDVKKLFTAFSISELFFIVTKTYIHYHHLELGYLEAYQAYFVAELVAWSIYSISVNMILKAVRMYSSVEKSQKLVNLN